MDTQNEIRTFGYEIPKCEYCGIELTQEDVDNNDTVCDYCHEQRIDEMVRKADMGILEEMGYIYG